MPWKAAGIECAPSFLANTRSRRPQQWIFLVQRLEKEEVYFCYPPVSEAGQVINKLRGEDEVEAVFWWCRSGAATRFGVF